MAGATDTSLHYFFEAKPRATAKVGAGGVASAGATTIPHTFVGLTEGNAYVVTVNRTDATGTTKNAAADTETLIGKVSGTNFINCIRAAEGTAQAWAADTVLEILVSATAWNKMVTGWEVAHEQTGAHKSGLTLPSPIFTGTPDLNGVELILDADADTSITSDTDDQVDVKIAGADDFRFTANTFTALSGSSFAADTISETTAAAGVTIDSLKIKDGGLAGDVSGWTEASDTWTYASASTFTIAGVDRTAIYTAGTRLKFTQTSAKYAVVVSSSFSTNTTVTIAVNTDYTIANAAITAPYYSYAANPQGYPGWFTFAPTWTGFSSGPTGTIKYAITGKILTLDIGVAGTSNADTFRMTTPVTLVLTPARFYFSCGGLDNTSTATEVWVAAGSTSRLDFYRTVASGVWTASGTKEVYFTHSFEIA